MASQSAHHLERCKSIFVSWSWLAAILVTLLITIGGISFAAGTRIQSHTNKIAVLEEKCRRMVIIDNKIDTLINIVREELK